jgi:hypothetical protein
LDCGGLDAAFEPPHPAVPPIFSRFAPRPEIGQSEGKFRQLPVYQLVALSRFGKKNSCQMFWIPLFSTQLHRTVPGRRKWPRAQTRGNSETLTTQTNNIGGTR